MCWKTAEQCGPLSRCKIIRGSLLKIERGQGVVNLDAFHRQTGWVHLDLESLGVDANYAFQAHDLLGEGRYLWQGLRNYVELTPESLPGHI